MAIIYNILTVIASLLLIAAIIGVIYIWVTELSPSLDKEP